jgi:hypothetical protein
MVTVAAPLSERQAARINPLGLLADDPSGLREAWLKIERLWDTTMEQAGRIDEARLEQRVGGEWSFSETLRHLIFVTDAWITDAVLEQPTPFDPLGLPPHFVTNGRELGLDLDAQPSFLSVADSRQRAMGEVRELLDLVTADDLDRPLSRFDGQFSVLGAVQNVIFEEWAHNVYATRDLAVLM